jgi:hypothetical protein
MHMGEDQLQLTAAGHHGQGEGVDGSGGIGLVR